MATLQGLTGIAAGLSGELAEIGRRVTRSVVEVRVEGHGAGAGTIWSADGTIVTNHHVAPAERASVTLPDGRTLAAVTVARDRTNDLAILKVQATALVPAMVGDARALKTGALVLAVGHPFGVKQALTAGIVTAAPAFTPGRGERELIRAALALRPGNSGGPLADAEGRVVGINAMVAGGLALAVPSHLVQHLLRAHSRPRTLGVQGRDVTVPAAYATAAAGAQQAVLIGDVAAGSPAAAAGLQAGDLLLRIAETAIGNVEALRLALQSAQADVITVRLLRGGRPLTIRVELAATERRAA